MSLYKKIRKHGIIGSYRIAMNVFCKPLRPFVYFFARLFPINENLILLESEPDLSDNAKALYSFLRSKKDFHFVWVVVNTHAYRATKDTVFISRLGCGLRMKAYYYYSCAKYIIFTHCTLPELVQKNNQLLIYTSHGCPMKAAKGGGTLCFDQTLSLGKYVAGAQAIFLGCEENKIIPLGYPRNDVLLQNKGNGVDNPFVKKDVKRLILWMPTFRGSVQQSLSEQLCDTYTGLPLFTSESSLIELNSLLEKIDVEIIVKIHHLQANKSVFSCQFSHLFFLTDDMISQKGLQLYEVVGKSDALITDYSSISFDYLLLDKPIGYVLDDFDRYESDRGFVWDNVRELMPGPHIYRKPDFYVFITEISKGRDEFQFQRARIKNLIHDHCDDCSCERFANYFFNS